jgi:dynein heavy chain 1, cytosolic
MKRTSENIKDPLFRCVEREVNFAANLLHSVRQDLTDIQAVCDGNKKQTNDTRDLLNNLSKGMKCALSLSLSSPAGRINLERNQL